MATIEKYTGKDGLTYRITVYAGFDTQGKRIRHRMNYKPAPGMTPRQIEKAAHPAQGGQATLHNRCCIAERGSE